MNKVLILDSLRGLAALWVCWFHACLIFYPGSQTQWWSLRGYLGVPIFFVISGFVIPYALEKSGYAPRNFLDFLAKRLVRLHPPFLASIALVILVGLTADFLIRGAHYEYRVKDVLLNSFLLVPFAGQPWLLKAYWTLAVELQWYLLAALCFRAYWTGAGARRFFLFALVACMIGALPLVFTRREILLPYLPLFILGVIAFRFTTQTIPVRQTLILVGIAALVTWWNFSAFETAAGLAACGCIILIRRSLPVLDALGKISYSLYLIHGLVLLHCLNSLPHLVKNGLALDRALRMSLGITLSIVASWALWRFIERPCQRISHNMRYRALEGRSA